MDDYTHLGNFAGWHLAQAQAAAAARNLLGLVSEQSIYNLAVREIELEVVPAARHYGLGILLWSPLGGGLLGGVLWKKRGSRRRVEGRARDTLERHRDQVQAYEEYAAELGHEPGDLALAWLLHQPAVTAPIIGPRTRQQLEASVRALEVQLDDDALARLDEIWPGYRPAPEHYAW